MISVKSLYILCLFFVFAYSIIKSLLYFLEQPTTFEENELEYSSSFPSLTLCFRQFEPDNFTTFQDIMQRIQDVETGGFIDGLLVITGKGVKRSFFDLRNKSVVEKEFNTDFDDVWVYSAIVQDEITNSIIICLTLNLPFIDSPKQGGYVVSNNQNVPKASKLLRTRWLQKLGGPIILLLLSEAKLNGA